ncbi:hypothetical protein GCM10011344_25040 [Dokdonia pacifica]|uniref:Uncharacterized protein n=1 Tax=Dokdonia pacifica TaxID=1627892 RepID=A0A238WQX1_9FLAO|nr:hypothetical protein [Dokdonia pacifica]GGG23293.1 hypothetical protein GCM10011344_25040 [Dokdonia pacifica]SNR48808.1 hypothetical protein SAMN06265376_1011340 [Dokdonia pacifica]
MIKEITKIFPAKITSEISGYNNLINFYRQLEFLENSNVILDLRNTYWFEANLCAALGAMIEFLKKRNNSVQIVNIRAPKDILARNGFLKSYGYERPKFTHNTEIEYRTFKEHQGKNFSNYVDNEVLNNEDFPKVSPLLNKKINQSICELFENARTHGLCENMHTCGQYFPTKSTMDFTIVDLGQTIKTNVNNFLNESLNGADCIEWAMKENNTTKTGNVSGGLGLALIFDFIEKNKGKIQIVSSDGYWEFRKGKIKKETLDSSFPGTIANLEFNFSDTKSYMLKEEVDIDNIF